MNIQTITVNIDFIPDEIVLKSFFIRYEDTTNAATHEGGSYHIIPSNSNSLVTFPISNTIFLDGTDVTDNGFCMFKSVNYRWQNKSTLYFRCNDYFSLNTISSSISFTATNLIAVSLTFEFIKH